MNRNESPKLVGALAAALLGICLVGIAKAGTITWTWVNPTQYEDNSTLPASDITQTRVEYGSCSAPGVFGTKAGEVVNTGNGTTVNKIGIAPGTYCSRAYTTAKGKESLASNVATNIIEQTGPKPPVLAANGTAAMVPVYNRRYDYWAMGDQVGIVRLGAECDGTRSYGNGYYALKDPKGDVKYYKGRRVRAVIAAKCA